MTVTNLWRNILLVLWSFFLLSQTAFALIGDVDKKFGIDANLRTTNLIGIPGENRNFFSNTKLRSILAGKPKSWLSYETHLVLDFSLSSFPYRNQSIPTYRVIRAAWNFNHDNTDANILLDRFNLHFDLWPMQIRIGRQAISFGESHFWNLLDVYAPFTVTDFDRDYKAGVDAVRVDYSLNDFSGLTLIGALGRTKSEKNDEISWRGSSILARVFTNVDNWDLSLQAGKIKNGTQLGTGIAGEINSVGVNGEAIYFWPQKNVTKPEFFAATVGLNYKFDSGIYLHFKMNGV